MDKNSFNLHIKMLFLSLAVLLQCCKSSKEEDPLPLPTLKIGVMLPYTGEYASDWNNSLDWAVENINHAGGVSGCNSWLISWWAFFRRVSCCCSLEMRGLLLGVLASSSAAAAAAAAAAFPAAAVVCGSSRTGIALLELAL